MTRRDLPRLARASAFALAAVVAACGPSTSPSGPAPRPAPPPAPAPAPALPPAPVLNAAGFPGFDTGIYPGDDKMRAWRQSSPYVWVGYYLPAPCHRETSWSGRRDALVAMGWGTAVIYLGQQDWAAAPGRIPVARDTAARDTVPVTVTTRDTLRADSAAARAPAAPAAPPACSSSNLSAQRGATEAADAAAKAAAEGFPPGSVVYLDVERVTAVSPALAAYVRAWIDGLLADGRYVPGIYCHRLNADALREIARAAFADRGRAGEAPFWVTSSGAFTLEQAPTAVGLGYASIWQGKLDAAETWGGFTLTVDANVADTRSPSSPR